jgi:GPH family glycoside/pentoside/hexuronide:cation symporter
MNKNFTVSLKEKIAYGMGDFALMIGYGAIGFYFVFFLTDVAGLPAAWAGFIFLIARVWDAFIDYAMGFITDATKSRWGRRRPYILFGAIPFGIIFALLWIVPFQSQTLLFIYYLSISVLFNTAFTIISIPYNSMMPELTQDYDERTSISGVRMALSFSGTLVAAAGIMVVVDLIFPGKSAYISSFPVMGMFFGLIIIASLLLTFFGTRERVRESSYSSKEGFFKTFGSIMKLKEFRIILGMFLFNMVGFDLIQVLLIYFLKHVIQVAEDVTFMVMAVPLVVAIAAAPLWVWLGEKWGKKKAYMVAAVYLIFSFSLCLIAPVGNLTFMLIISAMAGIGISASQVIPLSIIPDIIEIDEYENGTRREGAFYGITTFLYKVASAIAINVATLFLGFWGYIESTADTVIGQVIQPDSAINAIRIMMGVGPGIFFLISAVFVKFLPINKERFNEIKQIIEDRKKQIAD